VDHILTPIRSLFRKVWDKRLYHRGYFDMIDETASRSSMAMATAICNELRPARVVDYGCGSGSFLRAMRDRGCFVAGTEVSPPARSLCDKKGVPTIPIDLRAPPTPPFGQADLATSFEVAEHLPQESAHPFVGLLTRTAPVVVFSAATPGQGGQGHINEQPHGYWINHFRDQGFTFDEPVSQRLRTNWAENGVESWYARNVMVFRQS